MKKIIGMSCAFALTYALPAMAGGDKTEQQPGTTHDHMSQDQEPGKSSMKTGEEYSALSKDQVKEVQQALKDKGQQISKTDGTWGPESDDALKQFQQSEGIEVTGSVNEQTLSALGIDPQKFLKSKEQQAGEAGSEQKQQDQQQNQTGGQDPEIGGQKSQSQGSY